MIARFADVAALPADARALLTDAGRTEFQLGAAWFGCVAVHARPPGQLPEFLFYREAGQAVALLPLWRHASGATVGLTTPYTCVFRPLIDEGADDAALARAGRAFGVAVRAGGPLRLEALDPDWPGLAPLLAGFRAAGLLALRFDHFASWGADVTGLDWFFYHAARPGALREAIRRRLARADRDGIPTFELITGGAALAGGIDAYLDVHARSWKPAEPYPAFFPAILPQAAAAGVLRLGLLRQGGAPIAAQIWTVSAGTARLEKLAHVEAEKKTAPGTLLTALMLRQLLTHERIERITLGRGDDAYKAAWTGQRRQLVGVLLCPPWHPAGAAAIGRHCGGRLLALARSALGKPRGRG